MCGIAGFYLRNPNLEQHVDLDGLLNEMLMEIAHRGRDATGFVAISDDGVAEWQKAATEAKTFIKWRRSVPKGTRVVLAHTRFATQGLPAFIENNHPIRRGSYFIIHNGHVMNDEELFTTAKRKRFGQVDSEAIAARLASLNNLSFLGEVMAEIEGDAAVAAVDERDPTRLVVAKGEMSPLFIYDGRSIVMFASTRAAIEKAHSKHIGHIAANRVSIVLPGEQIEWHGDVKTVTEFEVKRRKFFTNWSYTPPANRALPAGRTTSLWEDDWDDDKKDYTCDNCTTALSFRETSWRYDEVEKFTYNLCVDCTALWDEGFFETEVVGSEGWEDDIEVVQGEVVDEDNLPQPRSFFDEYDQANDSILGRMGGFLRGI